MREFDRSFRVSRMSNHDFYRSAFGFCAIVLSDIPLALPHGATETAFASIR